jgi:hypothetical protein
MRIEILEIKRNILLCDYLEVKHDLVKYCFYVFNFLSLFLSFFPPLIQLNEHVHSFWNNNYSSKLAQQLLRYGHMIGMVDSITKILHIYD